MVPSLLLVCDECAAGLQRLGASLDPSPREISAGKLCDAHPTQAPAQAVRAVYAESLSFQRWVTEARGALSVSPPPANASEALAIASIAGQLLAGAGVVTDAEVAEAVETSRRILAAAKG